MERSSAVGASVNIPASAEKIDGKGLSVYPGMIDAGTNLGLAEIGQGANATMDVAETGTQNANAKAILAVNPHSSHVNVTRVNGITTVQTVPSGGLIAGQSAVINLNGSTQADMAVVRTEGSSSIFRVSRPSADLIREPDRRRSISTMP
jgi:imidazolonepropionase-like amidohydrolase